MMRSEQEMYDLILGYARRHDDIRAVILNGSRANPNRKPDPFNDYDIVYLVRDLAPYKGKPVHQDFGEILVYERTDENELYEEHFPDFVCYLMQFADGNRIDLTIADTAHYHGYCFDDRLSVVLLDKDGFLPPLPAPDESSHYIQKPTQQLFFECRTEFWWTAPYVSKGLWRGQLLFAQTHMESCIRNMLLQMLKWYAGALHGFELSAGKCGDKLQSLLPADIWNGYLETFAVCREEDIWRALFAACDLFTRVSALTAEALGFTIDDAYDRRVPAFLHYTHDLPRDAKTLDFTTD
ncbi:MAG: aminoglycoside 6-adenylyltransferase [Hominenteromicrobium sp.]